MKTPRQRRRAPRTSTTLRRTGTLDFSAEEVLRHLAERNIRDLRQLVQRLLEEARDPAAKPTPLDVFGTRERVSTPAAPHRLPQLPVMVSGTLYAPADI